MIILYTWNPINNIKETIKSLILSISTVKNFYNEIHVVTTTIGKQLLSIFDLNINIHTDLDNCKYDNEYWAAGKLISYSKFIGENFTHIDNDVFIGEPFKDSKNLFQSQEDKLYNNIVLMVEKHLSSLGYIPFKSGSLNVGTFRLEDKEILKLYIKHADYFFSQTHSNYHKDDYIVKMIYVEQHALSHLMKNENYDVIFDENFQKRIDSKKLDIEEYLIEKFNKDYNENIINTNFNLLGLDRIKYVHYAGPIKNTKTIQNTIDFILKNNYSKLYKIYYENY